MVAGRHICEQRSPDLEIAAGEDHVWLDRSDNLDDWIADLNDAMDEEDEEEDWDE